ncbi:GntR family transcriptional regulator [Streptomyces sp. B-S-A8]|uniref:GntR family transcriptional regulator n=1 Tax=Streptomyces solicavernae TaxID=3043614 RepID=A0ABT6RYM9_9ACTN|nr:GntR family transcriptional regulator [Streptomyces sp. B-S-A8]MDI3389552.1 GntR family transcriptional regulator [Streptomyces sp. B-S-A8]
MPLRQAVYDAIADMIIKRVLQPGEHIVEAELAAQLGVSRQPVREALQRLCTEGWVDLRPAQGAFVHVPTKEEADHLMAVRALLESESALLAAERATPKDIERLWELQEAGERALAADDSEGLVAANANLHAELMQIAGNSVLIEHIAMVDRRMRWYYAPIALVRGRKAWDEHASLIRAVAAHNAQHACELMRRHTETTRTMYAEQHEASV